MTITAEPIPTAARRRSFTVWYKDLTRWSVNTFSDSSWGWDPSMLRNFGDVAHRRIEMVTRNSDGGHTISLGSIHFDGSMSVRSATSKQVVKGRLFVAEPGDVVYSKIDARNGAVGVVPRSVGQLGFSAEYPIYQVDPQALDPDFLHLVLRSDHFRRTLNGMASGTSGRKRIQPSDLERAPIPVPPLSVQRRIVAAAAKTREQAARLRAEADEREAAIGVEVLRRLGLKAPEVSGARPRHLTVWWTQVERWGVDFMIRALQGGTDLHAGTFPVKTLGEIATVSYGIQKSPANRPGKHARPYLRVANVQAGRLDLSEIKYLEVPDDTLETFRLKKGDLLVCEGNSADLVGRPAIWNDEIADCVHQNHVLRVRVDRERVIPEYLLAYMQTPPARAHFRARAKRTTNLSTINSRDVKDLEVPCPNRPVQLEIVRQVERDLLAIARLRTKADGIESQARSATEQMILGALQP